MFWAMLACGSGDELGVGAEDKALSRPLTWEESSVTGGASRYYYGFDGSGDGDLNGDGFDDLAVGAYLTTTSATYDGTVFLHYGSPSGTSSAVKLVASDAAKNDYFGYSVAHLGDVDGDGYGDLAVGAYGDDDAVSLGGAAYVFYGSASGLDTSTEQQLTASDASSSDQLGRHIDGAGDVDGDGYRELIVGAYSRDASGAPNAGAAYLYYGAASGIDSASELLITASDLDDDLDFGAPVVGLGDVDGDGFDDLGIGALGDDDAGYAAGAVYLYFGSTSGLDLSSELKIATSDHATYDDVGWDLDAGDVDGDGYADVVIGAPGESSNAGAVYVFLGSASGLDLSTELKLNASDGAASDVYGLSVGSGMDLDGDGFDDLVVGAPYDDDAGSKSGSAYVYFGSASGIDASSEDKLTASDAAASDEFGFSVAGLGSLDGGLDGVFVGAWRASSSKGTGYVLGAECTDSDGDGACAEVECDDGDASTTAGPSTWYADDDGDGYGDSSQTLAACDEPSGYVDNDQDCDDTQALAWTGNTEVCDGVDNDCSGDIDSDAVDQGSWYEDLDEDGYGDPGAPVTACEQPSGTVDNTQDCDDTEALAWTGNTEVCDGVDNDCNGDIDSDAVDQGTWYEDLDEDGYGAAPVSACEQPSGTVDNGDDCKDDDPFSFPGAAPKDSTTSCMRDEDGDDYGDDTAPSGVTDGTDCDDTSASVNPGAAEVPDDGVDQDCDGGDEVTPIDSDPPKDSDPPEDSEPEPEGCGCSSSSEAGAGAVLLLLGMALVRRREGATMRP